MGGVSSLNVNGVQVFEALPDFMEFLNASTISESDFLNKVCIADTFDKINTSTNLPYAKDFVGKTITGISNTYNDGTKAASNTDWEIIGYNHDGSNNTFDLLAKSSVREIRFRSRQDYASQTLYNQNYEFSEIRTWLQSYVNNFSSIDSNLYSHLATMSVVYNFNTKQSGNGLYDYTTTVDTNTNTTGNNRHIITDKIKLLSCTEIGYSGSGVNYMPDTEGNWYSNKFSSFNSDGSYSYRIKNGTSGSAQPWWLRSRQAHVSYGIWTINAYGKPVAVGTDYTNAVVPCIRVAVSLPEYEQYLSSSSISIDNFLNKVANNTDVFDNGMASAFVGKTITGISNRYNNSSNVDWEIIDYNHDGSSNTFDLIAKKTVKDSVLFSNGSGNNLNQNYEFSNARSYLQSYVNNFSNTNSSLYSHLATMDVVYNFNIAQPDNQYYTPYSSDTNTDTTGNHKHTLNDKIKLLSATEIGYSGISYLPTGEGTIYSSKFSSKTSKTNISDVGWNSGYNNSGVMWWTRSRVAMANQGGCVWVSGGDLYEANANNNGYSVVPVIRIGV